ncbi:SDR family oxidoreductase (plasmid) [Rhizobium sullae]|uniref:SDR family oxidoreductase n=1 Tax=Rhizobium sullae TaxID=50338 RepID=A0ABY5XUD5_RHISU|nr:SDR family oxidoreductase [Rhizobium sullae]UWU18115.1 SDR family oxidoreductase [Rhizobium sullae]
MGNWDGLWLSAGYAGVTPLDAVDADFLDGMMNTNVRGPALQLAGPGPRLSKAGSVVITSSTARCWASALADRQVRVNVLLFGPIDTDFRSFMSQDLRAQFEKEILGKVLLGRIGSAGKAIAVALFLHCDDSSYVTGSQYAVDGGLTLP